jgi:anaerobic ribonucleoside-triphosphate reductase
MNKDLENKRQLTIIYSRVVGWITPIMNFNPGKSSEYKDRVVYTGEIKD